LAQIYQRNLIRQRRQMRQHKNNNINVGESRASRKQHHRPGITPSTPRYKL